MIIIFTHSAYKIQGNATRTPADKNKSASWRMGKFKQINKNKGENSSDNN